MADFIYVRAMGISTAESDFWLAFERTWATRGRAAWLFRLNYYLHFIHAYERGPYG